MDTKKATLCACKTKQWIPSARLAETVEALKTSGYEVEVVEDLCRTAMETPAKLQALAQTLIVACHSRAVNNLFRWRGVEAGRVANLRSLPTLEALKNAVPAFTWLTPLKETKQDDLLQKEAAFNTTALKTAKKAFSGESVPSSNSAVSAVSANSANEGWFPVIDKQRCVDCGRCLDFCLFGVYSKVDKQIVVAQPDKCKNNCPACARMCPDRAIIFPKYDKSPINGGLEEEETFSAESMEAIYNERLRYKLQERRQSVSLLKKPSSI